MDPETNGLLKRRRSIRRYLSKEVERDKIERILDAARYAPSAHNSQPWRYILIQDLGRKRALSVAMAEAWDRDLLMDGVDPATRKRLTGGSISLFTEAPVLILACASMEDMISYPDDRRRRLEYLLAVQSVAASIQNLLLQASLEGLGATWFCAPLFCQETVRELMGLPESVHAQALITLGYPAEGPPTPPRLPLEVVAYRNRWGAPL